VVEKGWLDEHVDRAVGTRPSALSFVVSDSDEDGYYISGFNIEEAVVFLEA